MWIKVDKGDNVTMKKLNRKRVFKLLSKAIVLMIVILGAAMYMGSEKNYGESSNADFTSNEEEEKSVSEQLEEKINSLNLASNPIEEAQTETDPFEDVDVIINDNRGVPVICYHSIGEDPTGRSPIIISPAKFREHMQFIKNSGYTTLTMSELYNYIANNKPIPEKSVVITFDDGYEDNYINAYPVLKELNMKATIFVISSYIDRETYLSRDHVKELSDNGIEIESHTKSHLRLGELSYDDQLKELKESKYELEQITGKEIVSIAYPEGIYNEDTKKLAEECGYKMAFTIKRGYADRDDNKYELNRICVDYTYGTGSVDNVLKNLPK